MSAEPKAFREGQKIDASCAVCKHVASHYTGCPAMPDPEHAFSTPCGSREGRDECWLCGLPQKRHPRARDRRGDRVSLTASQEAVLVAIRSLIESNGYSPTVREIGAAVGMRSSSSVHAHIEALKRKGALKPTLAGSKRTLLLASAPADA